MSYNKSKCINKQGVEILTDYCARILDPAVALEIDAHIAQCVKCREMVEAQRSVWEMLDAWTPREVSPNFDARLYARIAEEQSVPAWRRWLGRLFRPATPYGIWKPTVSLAAAGLVVALVTGLRVPDPSLVANKDVAHKSTVGYKGVYQSVRQGSSGSSDIDLDQVQQALDDMDLLTPVGQTPSSPL